MDLRRGDILIGLTDAGARLGVQPNTLRQQAENGILRAVLIGRSWVTTEREVERYRREHLGRVGPKPKRPKPKRPKKVTTEREEVAYHEAGHAFAAFHFGIDFEYVTILPDPERNTLGYVRFSPQPAEDADALLTGDVARRLLDAGLSEDEVRRFLDAGPSEDEERRRAEHMILVDASGNAAQSIYADRPIHWGYHGDALNSFHSASDVTGDPDERQAYMDWLWLSARSLVRMPMHWHMIDALAHALLERETITAATAREIMQDARDQWVARMLTDTGR
jgi:hypothetical protein